MTSHPALWPDLFDHLSVHKPDEPVLYFCPVTLQETARRFVETFPGLVTYAVKANDGAEVLENLVAAGVSTFDVASLAEMARVRAVLPEAVLHYHNPVRSRGEIAEAAKRAIASWSVDCASELAKLADVPRENTEIAVRMALPVAGAAYDFGSKFGATPKSATQLLRQARAMGFATSITFHPGTQCSDPEAWARYIAVVADVVRTSEAPIRRLNVGGGFAADRDGDRPDIAMIFARIKAETDRVFGEDAPELVCEPGRSMAAECGALAVRVKAVREDGAVFFNDGVYGALTEFRDIGMPKRYVVVEEGGRLKDGARHPHVVFGPTCDSIDRLPDVDLPEDIAEGDYVIFAAMGAYSRVLVTPFNGYGTRQQVNIARPWQF